MTVKNERGEPLRLRLVGLLKTSIFQSDLIVSEETLLRHFPSRGGFTRFLIESPNADISKTAEEMERALRRYGFDAVATETLLKRFHTIETTYLSAFQTLGSLGLLLGRCRAGGDAAAERAGAAAGAGAAACGRLSAESADLGCVDGERFHFACRHGSRRRIGSCGVRASDTRLVSSSAADHIGGCVCRRRVDGGGRVVRRAAGAVASRVKRSALSRLFLKNKMRNADVGGWTLDSRLRRK